ncbi:MAG: hypothetical protein DMG36_18475 [Acidobacteria bacterium]|nr:MAG: hypothetical protein DMG36_18475 [Acidobacteriota bacterium]
MLRSKRSTNGQDTTLRALAGSQGAVLFSLGNMSDLTSAEKRKFEQLLGMRSGYVLDFSNRTFTEFVLDSTGRDIFDSRYEYASASKANRLRAF